MGSHEKFCHVQRSSTDRQTDQITSGVRRILSHPLVYNVAQIISGGYKARRTLVREYISVFPGMRVLDIGCGTAQLLNCFPKNISIHYVGYDLSDVYIHYAKRKYGGQGTFFCASVSDIPKTEEPFDLVLAIGLLHHINDENAKELFKIACKALKPDGYMITLDTVFTQDQSWLARFFVAKDRGQHVRWPDEYLKLAKPFFRNIEVFIGNMGIIPSTHLVMRCSNQMSS